MGDELPADIAVLADATEKVPVDLGEVTFSEGETLAAYIARRGILAPTAPTEAKTASVRPLRLPLNPSGAEEKRKDVIATMLRAGTMFIDRSQFVRSADPPEGPAQAGLAYSYGSRDPWVRRRPPAGECTAPVFGLDCSGLLRAMALHAEIPLPLSTATMQSDVDLWNRSLPKSWGLRFVRVTDTTYQAGDIVYWSGGPHIGIVAGNGSNPKVIQSNGRSGPAGAECDKNLTKARGPNAVYMETMTSGKGWFKRSPDVVLRLETKCPTSKEEPEWLSCFKACSNECCDPRSAPPRCEGGILRVNCRGECVREERSPADPGPASYCAGRCSGEFDILCCEGGTMRWGCGVDEACAEQCTNKAACK